MSDRNDDDNIMLIDAVLIVAAAIDKLTKAIEQTGDDHSNILLELLTCHEGLEQRLAEIRDELRAMSRGVTTS